MMREDPYVHMVDDEKGRVCTYVNTERSLASKLTIRYAGKRQRKVMGQGAGGVHVGLQFLEFRLRLSLDGSRDGICIYSESSFLH